MSDNLAHKLNASDLRLRAQSKSDSYNSKSAELTLNRLKYQAGKSTEDKNDNQSNNKAPINTNKGGVSQQLNAARSAASKALSGEAPESAEEAVGVGTQVGTQWLLTTLWGSVWLDWTLLSLLGLNVLLAFSLLMPSYVCQFGDDYLIGKWIPSRDLAKWTEIILLMIINIFVLSIIILLIVIIYKLVSCSTWDLFNSYIAGILPGGDTAISEAQKRCFQ